jgi:plastocyanin
MILLSVIKMWITLTLLSLSSTVALTALSNPTLSYAQASENNTKLVHAGIGNTTDIVFAFIPQNMVIKAGESITWDTPNIYAEPHSVTFLNEIEYFPEFVVPFNVTNSTEFQPSDPNTSADPLFVPTDTSETTKTVVMVNARALIPVVIDSSGKNVTYLQPNSHYTMGGNEKLVNSGWLWPEGQAPIGSPQISNFTITFEKPGTYSYLCNLHPWMSGSVVVK